MPTPLVAPISTYARKYVHSGSANNPSDTRGDKLDACEVFDCFHNYFVAGGRSSSSSDVYENFANLFFRHRLRQLDRQTKSVVERVMPALDSRSTAPSHAEQLLAELGGSVEALSLVEWLELNALTDRVSTVVSKANEYLPGSVVHVRKGDGELDLEDVIVEIKATGSPSELYSLKSRFDSEWWLKQDRTIRNKIGVYLA